MVLAAAIWGLATVSIKNVLPVMEPSWLTGVRFLSAGIILAAVFAPRFAREARRGQMRDHLIAGLALGLFTALAYLLNTTGLTDTTAAKSSFLTAVYCVLAPFLAWAALRKKPTAFNLVAAVVCLTGVGLVALAGAASDAAPTDGGTFGLSLTWGDLITLGSAVFYAFEVVGGSVFVPGKDAGCITAIQFLVAGAITCAFAAATQTPPNPQALADPWILANLAFLVVGATCITMFFQNVGMAHTEPATGALLLSTESVFGALFGVMLLGDPITPLTGAGFALIFASILVSEWLPLRLSRGA